MPHYAANVPSDCKSISSPDGKARLAASASNSAGNAKCDGEDWVVSNPRIALQHLVSELARIGAVDHSLVKPLSRMSAEPKQASSSHFHRVRWP